MEQDRVLLFDLDGTLTDPGTGITNSVMYALNKFGIKEEDPRRLYPFIGPPLIDSFGQFYGFSLEKSRQAVAYYREYFSEKGIFENEVYEGIPELLAQLKEQGWRLGVATSKPEAFAIRIISHFRLDSYFSFIAGATMDESRSRKSDVIAYALDQMGAQAAKSLMIGDRSYDVLGAKEQGMKALGVAYGYGSRQELEQAGAVYVADTPGEIAVWIPSYFI